MRRIGLVAWTAACVLGACAEGGNPGQSGADATTQAGGGFVQVAQSAQPLPPGVIRVQRATIMDNHGMERPMVAAHVLIPAGWRTQGGVQWGGLGQCGGNYPINWAATSPDGLSSIAFVPSQKYSDIRTNMPIGPVESPCPRASWRSAKEFLEAMALRISPQARFLQYIPRPDLVKAENEQNRPFATFVSQTNRMDASFDAGELVIGYPLNGQDIRAILRAQMFIVISQYADLMNPQQIGMESIEVTPYTVMTARAPAASFDPRILDLFVRNTRRDYEWGQRIQQFEQRKRAEADQLFAEKMRLSREANATTMIEMQKRQNARMDALAEVGRINTGMYRDTDITTDRMRRENIEAIRGVETYHDPASGQGHVVQLDHNYEHAWRVRDGTYLLSKDPNFDPNRYGLEANKLEVVQ